MTTQPEFPSYIPEDVCKKFEDLAFDAWEEGFDLYSARTILERIRWHYQVERGNREFKCNDHWSPDLARWFLRRHPHMTGFFNLRERRKHGEHIDI